jgi:hypothetical protein
MEMLETVESLPIDVSPPFIVTMERKRGVVRARVRSG